MTESIQLRQNASEVNALRAVVRCCNEDGGNYMITQPENWPGLYVVWQYEEDDEDWTRAWLVWEGSPRVNWRGVDYTWRENLAYVKLDGDRIFSPPCPAPRELDDHWQVSA